MECSSKTITIISLIVFTLLVVALPATARMTSNKIIQSGDTIFQWERGLDLSQMNMSWRVDRLIYYADITNGETFSLIVSDPTSFDVEDRASNYVGRQFYLYNKTIGRLPQSVYIDNVKTIIDVVLDISRDDSVNGLVIPRDTILAVKISSNIAGAYLVPNLADNNFTLQVTFTSPDGIPFTIFGGRDFSKIMLDWTGKPITIGGINPVMEKAGQWSVQATWVPETDFAQAQANANSNTCSFNTAKQTAVSISATTTALGSTLPETVSISNVSQTTTPTPMTLTETTIQMTIPTTAPLTTVQPTTSAQTPGFGVLIAAMGLIFIAYLLLRK